MPKPTRTARTKEIPAEKAIAFEIAGKGITVCQGNGKHFTCREIYAHPFDCLAGDRREDVTSKHAMRGIQADFCTGASHTLLAHKRSEPVKSQEKIIHYSWN